MSKSYGYKSSLLQPSSFLSRKIWRVLLTVFFLCCVLAPPASANFLDSAYCKANPWYCSVWTTTTNGSNNGINPDTAIDSWIDGWVDSEYELISKKLAEVNKLQDRLDDVIEMKKVSFNDRETTRIMNQFKVDVIIKLKEDLQKARSELDALVSRRQGTQQNKQHQVKTPMPPDANLLYRLKEMDWWLSANSTRIDEGSGPRLSEGTITGTMIGGNMRLGNNSGIGFGVGYGTSDLKQTDLFGGGKVESDGLNLMVNGFLGMNENILFDGTLTYSYSSFENRRPTLTDSYDVYAFGTGVGVNMIRQINQYLSTESRIGWFGSYSTRKESTDTTGFRIGEMTSNFGRATARLQLLCNVNNQRGKIYSDVAIHMVTNDNSPANFDNDPFEAEVGVGFKGKLNDIFSASARAFIASIGRDHRDEYGGSISFGIDF